MAWNVTVPDTYAESHIGDTATEAGESANQASAKNIAKCDELASTHILYPVAIETGGTWNRSKLHMSSYRRCAFSLGDSQSLYSRIFSLP